MSVTPPSPQLPLQGFGLYKVPPQDAEELAYQAIVTGYRLLDTAAMYGNEEGVGAAVRRAVTDGLVRREDLFITSKLWNDRQGYDSALRAFQESREKLGLDYLDLYLIHWPCPGRDEYVQTWEALLTLPETGQVRQVGVSNFLPEHLDRLADATGVFPAVNQVEVHPWLQQQELRAYHQEHGVTSQAWSPLARGQVLQDPAVMALAESCALTPAQLVLCWLRDSGISAVPKASSTARMRENFDLPPASLSAEIMEAMASLDQGKRVGSDPRNVA
ncbi:aldo/keto reductase [Psychromicrobium xiongbiense]|uniref:aldo/keto reductase n=1 Tax=Psychromicrobium xiongbiense TaxID=3051184 RepID=UPI002554A17F|nr:aldo/keto reductase [Psychromicrobium sp. YIM S02556]